MISQYLDLFADLLLNRNRVYWKWRLLHSNYLKKYKDIHSGCDCFIIGNGPSLNKHNLSCLENYYTFGLNKIYLLFDKSSFRPSYHVAVNPLVIQQSVKEFESLTCPSFLSYLPSEKIVRNLDHINFLLTKSGCTFSGNISERISEGWTVTYIAMQIAYYMGFKTIFLIGVDHNFVSVGLPNEKQFLAGSDPNHFDPNYFGGKEWQLPDLQGSEASFNLAKFFYERDNRKIYDATIDGKLSIFQKISFNDALSLSKKRNE